MEGTTQPQPVHTPAPQRAAKPPLVQSTVWTVFGSLLILLSLWLFIAAVAGALALFTNRAPSFDAFLSLIIPNLSSFTGVTIAAFGSVIAAVSAFMIFNRAVKSGTPIPEAPVRGAAVVSGLQATILTISAFGVGVAPLLTLKEGADVGPVYLVQFLPLALGALLFAGATYYFLRVLAGRVNLGFVSLVVLAASIVALVLGVVAVAVKSHDDSYSGGSSSIYKTIDTYDTSTKKDTTSTDEKKDESTTKKNSTSTGSSSAEECVSKYRNGDYTITEYVDCYKKAASSGSDD